MSIVQTLASLQSSGLAQQPAMAAWTHTPPVQASVVQALLSSQLLSLAQETTCCHWHWNCKQLPVAAPVGSTQSASVAQQLESGLVGLVYFE